MLFLSLNVEYSFRICCVAQNTVTQGVTVNCATQRNKLDLKKQTFSSILVWIGRII